MFEILALSGFAGLLVIAACNDVATMTIPNWISIVLALSFAPAALIAGMALPQVGLHLAFGAAMLVVCFVGFQFGVLGGGDAKLIAAASVWTGVAAFGPFAFVTALSGGVMALALLVTRSRVKPDETRPAFVNRLLKPRGGVPYGVAIMAGGIACLQTLTLAGNTLTLP
jgi:prepilin peptidase CpaA